jgi:hypothetical protein
MRTPSTSSLVMHIAPPVLAIGVTGPATDGMHITLLLHSWWRLLVLMLALLPVGLLLLQFVMAKYLDRVGIHYSYTTNWFAGFRTFYHYNLRAHSNGWPMWPVYLHWAGLVVFVMLAVIFIVG